MTLRHRGEWRPEVVRNLLLTLGAILLAVAALVFSAVAWSRLDDAGRAMLLFAATAAAGGLTAAFKRRLPLTAEALAGVTIAMLLVDWSALRRAGAGGDMSTEAWWTLGTVLTALASFALDAGLRLGVARALGSALAVVGAMLCVDIAASTAFAAGVGWSVVAWAAAAIAGRAAGIDAWRWSASVLAVGAGAAALAALTTLVDLLPPGDDLSTGLRPALVLALVAGAPALARSSAGNRLPRETGDVLVGAAAALTLAAAATLLATEFHGAALLAVTGWFGVAWLAVGRMLPEPAGRGTMAVGLLGAGLAAAVAVRDVAVVLLEPLEWITEAWTGDLATPVSRGLPDGAGLDVAAPPETLAGLAAVAMVGLVAVWPLPGRRRLLESAAGLALIVAAAALAAPVVPVAIDAALGWALTIDLAASLVCIAGAVAFARRRAVGALPLAIAGGVLALPAGGWMLASDAGTLWTLSVVAVASGVAAAAVGRHELGAPLAGVATAALVGDAAAIALALGGHAHDAGLTAVAAAAVFVPLAAGAARAFPGDVRHPVVEMTASASIVVGLTLTVPDHLTRSVGLTVSVIAFALAAASGWRVEHLWIAAVAAVLAVWSWLAAAGVTVVEAYTVPAGGIAVTAGALTLQRRPRLSSWPALGSGLAIGMLPTLAIALDGGGVTRPLVLTIAALVVLAIASRASLQAPFVIGAACLLSLGLDALGPMAAQLPRWLTLGVTGVVVLWLGATAEARLGDLRRARSRYEALR